MNSSLDSPKPATTPASDEQVGIAARALASLSPEQLHRLISSLPQAPADSTRFSPPSTAVPHAESRTPDSADAATGIASGRSQTFSQNLASRLWELFVALSPAILALILAPYVIRTTFEHERAVAKPHLSIEYVFLTEQQEPISPQTRQAIASITTSDVYIGYLRQTFGQNDLGLFLTSAQQLSPAMQARFSTAVATYRDYLHEKRQEHTGTIQLLSTLPLDRLRMMGHTHLDSIIGLDEGHIREQLNIRFNDKLSRVADAITRIDELSGALESSRRSIRMKVSILNKGATDGLVRHQGKLEYRGRPYDIFRTAPPSSDLRALAVPTFQTNEPAGVFSAQSVGKAEKDSMTEFWYEFSPDDDSLSTLPALCEPDETIQITLRDHEYAEVSATLPCEGEA